MAHNTADDQGTRGSNQRWCKNTLVSRGRRTRSEATTAVWRTTRRGAIKRRQLISVPCAKGRTRKPWDARTRRARKVWVRVPRSSRQTGGGLIWTEAARMEAAREGKSRRGIPRADACVPTHVRGSLRPTPIARDDRKRGLGHRRRPATNAARPTDVQRGPDRIATKDQRPPKTKGYQRAKTIATKDQRLATRPGIPRRLKRGEKYGDSSGYILYDGRLTRQVVPT